MYSFAAFFISHGTTAADADRCCSAYVLFVRPACSAPPADVPALGTFFLGDGAVAVWFNVCGLYCSAVCSPLFLTGRLRIRCAAVPCRSYYPLQNTIHPAA